MDVSVLWIFMDVSVLWMFIDVRMLWMITTKILITGEVSTGISSRHH